MALLDPLRQSVRNWRESDLPFGKKLRVWLRNEKYKVRHLRTCCDQPGQPGC